MKGTYRKNRAFVTALAALINAVGLLFAFIVLGLILVVLGRVQRRAST